MPPVARPIFDLARIVTVLKKNCQFDCSSSILSEAVKTTYSVHSDLEFI